MCHSCSPWLQQAGCPAEVRQRLTRCQQRHIHLELRPLHWWSGMWFNFEVQTLRYGICTLCWNSVCVSVCVCVLMHWWGLDLGRECWWGWCWERESCSLFHRQKDRDRCQQDQLLESALWTYIHTHTHTHAHTHTHTLIDSREVCMPGCSTQGKKNEGTQTHTFSLSIRWVSGAKRNLRTDWNKIIDRLSPSRQGGQSRGLPRVWLEASSRWQQSVTQHLTEESVCLLSAEIKTVHHLYRWKTHRASLCFTKTDNRPTLSVVVVDLKGSDGAVFSLLAALLCFPVICQSRHPLSSCRNAAVCNTQVAMTTLTALSWITSGLLSLRASQGFLLTTGLTHTPNSRLLQKMH